jgi:hypothetical protein
MTMKKQWLGLALALVGSAASAQSIPFVTNSAQDVARRTELLIGGLSEYESNRLDQITASAAARAVIALRCEGVQFEPVSRRIEQVLEAKVVITSANVMAAREYARDAARMKYRAMVQSNTGVGCDGLDRLREIAAIEGFDK